MKKYKLRATITVSTYTVVEADSLEEAIEKSGDRSVEWRDNGGAVETEDWIVSELDGEPQDISEDLQG